MKSRNVHYSEEQPVHQNFSLWTVTSCVVHNEPHSSHNVYTHPLGLGQSIQPQAVHKLCFPFLNPLAGFVLVLAGNRRHTQEGRTHTDLGRVKRIPGDGEACRHSTGRAVASLGLKGKERSRCYWIRESCSPGAEVTQWELWP